MNRVVSVLILLITLVVGCGNGGDTEKMIRLEDVDDSILTAEEKNLKASVIRLRVQVDEVLRKALNWINSQNEQSTPYSTDVGLTSLAIMAFLEDPAADKSIESSKVVQNASYVVSMLKPDGAIYGNTEFLGEIAQTALAVSALSAIGNPIYDGTISQALSFLRSAQLDETEEMSLENPNYGGFPARLGDRVGDIVTTSFVLDAMVTADVPPDDPIWDKVLLFLQSCQHYDEFNELPWASTNNGGFVTSPSSSTAGFTEEGVPIAYGSATYAGLLAYLNCGLASADMRVRAAIKWVMNNFSSDMNPGLQYKAMGEYYYFMSKALKKLGNYIILDAQGNQHRWFAEMFSKIRTHQDPEGFWRFESPEIDTVFIVLALEEGYPRVLPIPGLDFRMKGKRPKK